MRLVSAGLVAGLVALSLLTTPALAADGAQSNAIGYSPDGRYFAFEQYGDQDGSGFKYWDIFVLDTVEDKWVKGTPVRALVEEETPDAGIAKRKAWAEARPIIEQLKIENPVDTLAHRPATEMNGGDRRTLRFSRYYNSTGSFTEEPHMNIHEVSVKAIALPASANCPDMDIALPMGMEVTLKKGETGQTVVISKDTSIPSSRNCAHDYDVEAVFAPSGYGLLRDPLVALIGVYSRGFEGSDRRFIAVPFELIE